MTHSIQRHRALNSPTPRPLSRPIAPTGRPLVMRATAGTLLRPDPRDAVKSGFRCPQCPVSSSPPQTVTRASPAARERVRRFPACAGNESRRRPLPPCRRWRARSHPARRWRPTEWCARQPFSAGRAAWIFTFTDFGMEDSKLALKHQHRKSANEANQAQEDTFWTGFSGIVGLHRKPPVPNMGLLDGIRGSSGTKGQNGGISHARKFRHVRPDCL